MSIAKWRLTPCGKITKKALNLNHVQNAFNPKSCVFRFHQFGGGTQKKTIPTLEYNDLPALLQEHLRSLTQHHREAAKTVRELRQAEDDRKVQEVEQSKSQEQRQKMKSQRQDLSLWI